MRKSGGVDRPPLPEEKFFKKTIDKLKKIKYNKDTKKTKNKFKKEVLNYD